MYERYFKVIRGDPSKAYIQTIHQDRCAYLLSLTHVWCHESVFSVTCILLPRGTACVTETIFLCSNPV